MDVEYVCPECLLSRDVVATGLGELLSKVKLADGKSPERTALLEAAIEALESELVELNEPRRAKIDKKSLSFYGFYKRQNVFSK
jgi:hypothetical protein